ncbi:hypothetical protein [Lapillicoccus sp.]|uniref:hypothetical protein n=1 Tax=Lapillicoccus sp. TaxID=1909287 RepID=UPI003266D043
MTTVLKTRSARLLATRVAPYAALALTGALTLSACGGSGTAASPAPASTSATQGAQGVGQAGGQGGSPGVTGLVAAVTGSTMQVQTRTDQTAVSWTGSTMFTSYTTAALADVAVGSCVTVTEPITSASSGASGSPGAAPATAVAAATVQVRPAAKGACTGGFARRGVSGRVTAVSGDVITVQVTMRQGRTPGSTVTSETATSSPTPTSVAITTTSSTTYLKEVAATAADVSVGECATALGKADDTGSVAATAVTLRPATKGSCTAGRGAGGAAGAGGAGGAATTGTTHG